MPRAYLGLGSNIGHREAHLAHALRRLDADLWVKLLGVSSVYETEPVGRAGQPPFLNMVAAVDTALEPGDLLSRLRSIETERGRERSFPNAPRTLDIDILLYDDRILDRPGLTIPHPRMAERDFVLVPLVELAPDLTEPGTGRRYDRLRSERPAGIRPVMTGDRLLEEEWE